MIERQTDNYKIIESTKNFGLLSEKAKTKLNIIPHKTRLNLTSIIMNIKTADQKHFKVTREAKMVPSNEWKVQQKDKTIQNLQEEIINLDNRMDKSSAFLSVNEYQKMNRSKKKLDININKKLIIPCPITQLSNLSMRTRDYYFHSAIVELYSVNVSPNPYYRVCFPLTFFFHSKPFTLCSLSEGEVQNQSISFKPGSSFHFLLQLLSPNLKQHYQNHSFNCPSQIQVSFLYLTTSILNFSLRAADDILKPAFPPLSSPSFRAQQ